MIKKILVVLLVGFCFCVNAQFEEEEPMDIPSIAFGFNLTSPFSSIPTNTFTLDMKVNEGLVLTAEYGFAKRSFNSNFNNNSWLNTRFLIGPEVVVVKRPYSYGFLGLYLFGTQSKNASTKRINYVNYIRSYQTIQERHHYGVESRVGHTWYDKYYSISFAIGYEVGCARAFSRNARRPHDKSDIREIPIPNAFGPIFEAEGWKWHVYGLGSLNLNIAFPLYFEEFELLPKEKLKLKSKKKRADKKKKVDRKKKDSKKKKRKRKRKRKKRR